VSGFHELLGILSSNNDPGVSVDDIEAACKRFDDMNVKWKKRLTEGRMKDIAFVLDPDNYWIEVIQNDAGKRRSEL
jgi:lactoylglutathione lyase